MDIEALGRSPIGQIVPITGTDGRTGEHYQSFAYLADPLPESVQLWSETWTIIARAEAALARLDQAARQVPSPELLRDPAIRREAQSTSALEGTFAPFVTVLESDLADRGQLSLAVLEILNYVAAAQLAFEWVEERPLTSGLMGELQRTLVQGTAGEHSDAGGLRDREVFIGPPDAPISDARFVPAPHGDQLKGAFEQWVTWVSRQDLPLPPVVQAGLAHYQFETLHPYSDGNGRIGRLAIVLQLMRLGVLRYPILVVSPWFEARRTEYQDALLALSTSGNWSHWLAFFATGVLDAAETTHHRIEGLLDWQDDALRRVRESRASGLTERLAADLIGLPILRAGQVAQRYGVTHQAAMNALRRLEGLGLLAAEAGRGRVTFRAPEIVELLGQ
jgi:Fic family protein